MEPGRGRVVINIHDGDAVVSELSSTYPLKLLSSRNPIRNVAVVYTLSYGGGLVGGDSLELTGEVGSNAILVLLSQGSTKVFKTRPSVRLARMHDSSDTTTQQLLSMQLAPSATLLLLPDPVTCFRKASYRQVQKFKLASDSSLVLLDWLTSGRASTGEAWDFHRYYSLNEIWINDKRMARDALLLDHSHANVGDDRLPDRTLANRLAPYYCYASLILVGPVIQAIVADIRNEYSKLSVFQRGCPERLMWSISPLAGDVDQELGGWIVRVAATETEEVKGWLAKALKKVEDIVGEDVYRRAFT